MSLLKSSQYRILTALTKLPEDERNDIIRLTPCYLLLLSESRDSIAYHTKKAEFWEKKYRDLAYLSSIVEQKDNVPLEKRVDLILNKATSTRPGLIENAKAKAAAVKYDHKPTVKETP